MQAAGLERLCRGGCENEEGKERGNTREGEGDEMEMIDGVYMKCIGFVC